MRKNIKSKLLIVLFILLAILLILIAIVKYFDPDKKVIRDYGYETMSVYRDPEIQKELDKEKTIRYENISVLQNLIGETPVSTTTKRVKEVFLNNIPNVIKETNDMSDEELTNYFNDNKTEISKKLSVDNETSFLNMISKFRELKSDLFEDCTACKFIDDNGLGVVVYYANEEIIECNIIGNNAECILFEF